MDEFTFGAIVNRDEPIPVINVSGNDDAGRGVGGSSDTESKHRKVKKVLTGSKLKEKLHDATNASSDSSHSLQDRLFAK